AAYRSGAAVEQAGRLRLAAIEALGEGRGGPFPDIAGGVEQAEAIARKLACRGRLVLQPTRAGAAPAVRTRGVLGAVQFIAPPVAGLAAATCGIFPLRFGRQTVAGTA